MGATQLSKKLTIRAIKILLTDVREIIFEFVKLLIINYRIIFIIEDNY